MAEETITKKNHQVAPMKIIGTVLLILLGLALVYKVAVYLAVKPKNDFQAVFLTNGQVYFGEISKMTENTLILRNIFYLQVADQTLQGEANDGNQTRLIKLGNELHGPEDVMYINREQVLFYEDLKDDSTVVQSINDFEVNNL